MRMKAFLAIAKPIAPPRVLVSTSPIVEFRPGISRNCVVSMRIASMHIRMTDRIAWNPEIASPIPSGTKSRIFRIALTPPSEPQTTHKCDSTALPDCGSNVANPITAKLAVATTNPALRRCGAGATVQFIRMTRYLWRVP
jgi:hypothetical protein